jgi:hypothetical protein
MGSEHAAHDAIDPNATALNTKFDDTRIVPFVLRPDCAPNVSVLSSDVNRLEMDNNLSPLMRQFAAL